MTSGPADNNNHPGGAKKLLTNIDGGNGQSIIDGNRVDVDQRLSLAALSYGLPLGRTQSVKFAYVRSRTNTENGSDTDSIAIAWSKRF